MIGCLCTIPTGSYFTSAKGYTEDSILMFHLASTIILSFFIFVPQVPTSVRTLEAACAIATATATADYYASICLSGRHPKWSPLSLSQHRCEGGNSGEHSCAASLVNHGNCSFLTEFNIIKAQQEKRISAASGGSSPGVVISISASSGRNSTILMNVCFSICWEAYSSHYVFFFFSKNKNEFKRHEHQM